MGVDKVQLQIEAITTQFNKEITEVRGNLRKTQQDVDDMNEEIRGQFEKTGKAANEMGGIFKTLFSVTAIVAFISKMIQMRSEWEKQEQVLKSLTGSQIEAANSMKMMKSLAETNRVEIKAVTDGYIRLVAQGIKPTQDQMKRLIDLAVSQNRTFEQLAEAIYDASNKNTKGLRDLGVTSKITGDKIKLTFGDITKEVNFSAQAIADFLIEMGSMDGIMGVSADEVDTVATSVGDLKEAWQSLILTMGEQSQGAVKFVFDFFAGVIGGIEKIIELRDRYNLGSKQRAAGIVNMYAGDPEIIKKITSEIAAFNKEIAILERSISMTSGEKELKKLEEEKTGIEDIVMYLNEWVDAQGKKKIVKEEDAEAEKKAHDAWMKMQREENSEEKRMEKEDEDAGKKLLDGMRSQFKTEEELNKEHQEQLADDTKDLHDAMLSDMELADEEYQEELKKKKDKEKEDARNAEIAERILRENKAQAAIELVNLVSAMNQSAMERELAAAGENEEQKEKIRRKYANREKAFAIMRAIISGAEAILKNTAQLGTIPAQPVNVWQGIITAIQVATIAAQKFATGIFDLQGRGTGTSDSIPAMLSRGESVMTAKETSEYYPYLKAMKDGTFPRFQMDMLEKLATVNNNLNYDNSKEIQVLRSIDKKLGLNKPEFIYVNGKKIIKYNSLSSHVN